MQSNVRLSGKLGEMMTCVLKILQHRDYILSTGVVLDFMKSVFQLDYTRVSPNFKMSLFVAPTQTEQAVVEARLRFVGRWKRSQDIGFRELIHWMGVPWLLSFVVARKSMSVDISFKDNDAAETGTLIMVAEDHTEHLPLNGTFIDVLIKQPFERVVKCSAQWEASNAAGENTNGECKAVMILNRIDHATNSMKTHKTEATVTRHISADGNTMVSLLKITRLTDNTSKEATLYFERQKS